MRSDRTTDLARIMLVGAFLLAMPSAQFARGQDDWGAEDRAAAAPAMQRNNFDAEQYLNSIFYRNTSGNGGRESLDSVLKLRLDSLERAGGLSKAQIEKLQLAGRADITRFVGKVDALKEECRGMDVNNQNFQNIWPKISALQTELNSGLLNNKSLYSKALEKMSRADPSAPFVKPERERRKFRHRAALEMAVSTLEFGVPLTDVQRRKFIDLLVKETEPPKRYGDQDIYVVFYQASKLDAGKLKPIFDDAQWQALREMFDRAKSMEAHLRSQGYIP
jgi:hypothetical protein